MSCDATKISSKDWYCLVSIVIVPTLLDLTAACTPMSPIAPHEHIRYVYSWMINRTDEASTSVSYTAQKHMYWTLINLSCTSRRFALDVFKIIDQHRDVRTILSIPWPLFQAYAYYKLRKYACAVPYHTYLQHTFTHLSQQLLNLSPGTPEPGPLLAHLASLNSNGHLFSPFIDRLVTNNNSDAIRGKLLHAINDSASSSNDSAASRKLFMRSCGYIHAYMPLHQLSIIKQEALLGVIYGAIFCDNPTIVSAALTSLSSPKNAIAHVPDGTTTACWALRFIQNNHYTFAQTMMEYGSVLMLMWLAHMMYAYHHDLHGEYTMTPTDIIDEWGHTVDTYAPKHQIARFAKTIVNHTTWYQLSDRRYAELFKVFCFILQDDFHVCKLLKHYAYKHTVACALPLDVFLDIVGREHIQQSALAQAPEDQISLGIIKQKHIIRVAAFYMALDLLRVP